MRETRLSGLERGGAGNRSPYPYLDLLPDASQISREEAFPAQKLANGFIRGLSFQVDLELFLRRQKPPLLAGGLLRSFRWIGVGHFFASIFDRRRGRPWFRSTYGLPPPWPPPPPCSVLIPRFEVTNSETAGLSDGPSDAKRES